MKQLILLGILPLVAFSASGQSKSAAHTAPAGSSTEKLTVQQVITEALAHNPALAAKHIAAKVARAEISPAGALEDPELTLQAMNYPLHSFDTDKFEMTGNQIELMQRFPAPGKRAALRDAAAAAYRAERAQADLSELQLIRDVKLAYLARYEAEQAQRMLQQKILLVADMIASSRERYAAGTASQSDVLALQITEAQIRSKLLEQEAAVRARRADLNTLMGRADHSAEWRITEPTPSPFNAQAAEQIDGSPRLKLVEANIVRAKREQRSAQLSIRPDFEVGEAYTQRQPVGEGSGDDFVSARIGFSIPLYAGSKQRKQQQAADLRLRQANLERQQESLHLAHEIEVVRSFVSSADAQLKILNTSTIQLAQQGVATAQSSYIAGEVGYRDVLEAMDRSIDAELERVRVVVERESKIAELDALMGTVSESKEQEDE